MDKDTLEILERMQNNVGNLIELAQVLTAVRVKHEEKIATLQAKVAALEELAKIVKGQL